MSLGIDRLKQCCCNFITSLLMSVLFSVLIFAVVSGSLWVGSSLAVNVVPIICFEPTYSLVGCYSIYTFLIIFSSLIVCVISYGTIVLIEIVYSIVEPLLPSRVNRLFRDDKKTSVRELNGPMTLWVKVVSFVTRKITLEEYVFSVFGAAVLILVVYLTRKLPGLGVLVNFSLIVSFIVMTVLYSFQRFFSTGCGYFVWTYRSFVFTLVMVVIGFLFYLYDIGILASNFTQSEILYLIALFVGSVVFAVVMVVSFIEPGIYFPEEHNE